MYANIKALSALNSKGLHKIKTSTRTYARTDRQRVINFVLSIGISESERKHVAEIFEKSSFSARDLKVLLQIVTSKHEISQFQLAALGLPIIPSVAQQTGGQKN